MVKLIRTCRYLLPCPSTDLPSMQIQAVHPYKKLNFQNGRHEVKMAVFCAAK